MSYIKGARYSSFRAKVCANLGRHAFDRSESPCTCLTCGIVWDDVALNLAGTPLTGRGAVIPEDGSRNIGGRKA